MRLLIFFLIIMVVDTTTAQYYPVDTMRLCNAYRALIKGPNTLEKQKEFLKAFPSTWLEYTLTYLYSPDKGFNNRLSQYATKHSIVFADSLYLIDDTTYCRKYIELTTGMQDTGELCTEIQGNLHKTMEKRGDTMMYLLSRMRKGHQLQFWMFYWSTSAKSNWVEEFPVLYNKYRLRYPQETERMRIAFENFEDGIEYPNLLPHAESKK